jgi:hypothetical protein
MTAEQVCLYTAPEGWKDNPDYVYCGRPGKGVNGYWGNPIKPGNTCAVCKEIHVLPGETLECYEAYIFHRIGRDKEFVRRLRGLNGKKLVCFCKDVQKCHVSILIKALESLDNMEVEF